MEREVVVITGATAGVGRAVAREFAKKGAKIGLIARGMDGLKATKKEIEEMGGSALICQADVADPAQVENAAQMVEATFGPIDVWVNNAMNSVFSPVKEMKPEEYKRVTEVTYLGQVYGTLSALKRMLPRDKGKIVFVGSALAYRAIPLQSAYCGAKHASNGFFESLRTELLHDKSNVKVSMVHLPAMNTPQFGWVKSRLPYKPKPMGKIFQPEVAARAIYYAAHHDRREMLVGMPTVKAVWGDKLVPWFADWVLSRSGIKGQQTSEPEEQGRENNVWTPVAGDHGAHGTFGEQAKSFSPQSWVDLHLKEIGMSIAAIAAGFAAVKLSRKYR